ncbi:hypothetical protein RHAB21_02665 [Pseudorhizobium halotolerans]|uniref:HEPN AbiU2-like domain-containing protein n=1 Tax=Pseudorhizobium halotolerans TaxID=1233081 RepID=A0ABM8PM64_9HYPH|nr:hypothetical protein [Pseudorhizobium halotolerans]CAD7037494.1 hypothetical protein RHAB21_02665 [Pseudorhizobium halotolerans]
MESRHLVVSPFINERWEFEVSPDCFAELAASRSLLIEYVRFEELGLQVLYAFQEYEKFVLGSALEHSLFPLSPHEFEQEHRIRANIKVLSLLNSITSFRDQLPKFRKSSLAAVRRDFINSWRETQTKSAAFNFCERLRNFSQHHFQPVSFTTSGGAWSKEREFLEHRVSLYASVEEVCRSQKVDAAERQSYREAFGERADISLILRETMGCIGQFTRRIRSGLQSDVDKALSCYDLQLREISARSKYEVGSIVVRSLDGETKQFDIFSDFAQWVRKLRRTFYSQNNERHYVSSRSFGHRNPT